MRRPGRTLLNAASGVSLVLFAAACALWVRSYGVGDAVFVNRFSGAGPPGVLARTVMSQVSSWQGDISFTRTETSLFGRVDGSRGPRQASSVDDTRAVGWDQHRAGEQPRGYHRWPPPTEHAIWGDGELWIECRGMAFGHGWLALASGLLPAILLLRGRRRRRARQAGMCPACGYDLRATPDRCPECGAVPAGARGNAEAQRR